MKELIEIDDLRVRLKRSARRKTVALVVDRVGGVELLLPEKLSDADAEGIIKRKQLWIYKTLDIKRRGLHETAEKDYVSGESFFFSGRKHSLSLQGEGKGLTFHNGRFYLPRALAANGRKAFVDWYTEETKTIISERIDILSRRVAVFPGKVTVQDLGFNWASCGKGGRLYFNWKIAMLPLEIVDYLMTHELIHLKEPRHSQTFYTLLVRAVPNYKQLDRWLLENGGKYQI